VLFRSPCEGLIYRSRSPTDYIKRSRNWKSSQDPTKGCTAIDRRTVIVESLHTPRRNWNNLNENSTSLNLVTSQFVICTITKQIGTSWTSCACVTRLDLLHFCLFRISIWTLIKDDVFISDNFMTRHIFTSLVLHNNNVVTGSGCVTSAISRALNIWTEIVFARIIEQ
jgi:hypothetical protein